MSHRCLTERIVQGNATTVIRTCDRLAGIKFDGTVKLVSPKRTPGELYPRWCQPLCCRFSSLNTATQWETTALKRLR